MQRAACASGQGVCCPVLTGDAFKIYLNFPSSVLSVFTLLMLYHLILGSSLPLALWLDVLLEVNTPPHTHMYSLNCPDDYKPLPCSLYVSLAFPLSCLLSSPVRLWERSQLHFCTCRVPTTVSRHCNHF